MTDKLKSWDELTGRVIRDIEFGETIKLFFDDAWAELGVDGGGAISYDDNFRPGEPEELIDYDFRSAVVGQTITSIELPHQEAPTENVYYTLRTAGGGIIWIFARQKPQRPVTLI